MANEKRLIDVNALKKRMLSYYECVNEHTSKSTYTGETLMDYEVADMIEDCIDNAPTVDAVEVVHGRWEPRTDVVGFVRCSVCHDCNVYDDWADGKKWNYCPNCGAKMDGGVKNERERQTDRTVL